MRLAGLFALACPACHADLTLHADKVQHEALPGAQDDPHRAQKVQRLVERVPYDRLYAMAERLSVHAGIPEALPADPALFAPESPLTAALYDAFFCRVVHTGSLSCTACQASYPIKNRIPRFVSD